MVKFCEEKDVPDLSGRAVLTLSIEGARFSDMDMGRVVEIFGLLAKIAGEGSVLVRYSGGEIIVKEGRPGSASETAAREEDKEPRTDVDIPKPVMGNPPYKGSNDAWLPMAAKAANPPGSNRRGRQRPLLGARLEL